MATRSPSSLAGSEGAAGAQRRRQGRRRGAQWRRDSAIPPVQCTCAAQGGASLTTTHKINKVLKRFLHLYIFYITPVATMDSSSATLLAEVSAMSTRMLAMESRLATQQQTTVDTDVLLHQGVVGSPSGFLREEVLQPIRPEAPLQVGDSGPSPLECLATVALDTGTTDTQPSVPLKLSLAPLSESNRDSSRAGRPDRASGHRHSSRSARSSSRHTSVSGAARTGHRSPVTGHRASDTGHRAPGARHRAPDTGQHVSTSPGHRHAGDWRLASPRSPRPSSDDQRTNPLTTRGNTFPVRHTGILPSERVDASGSSPSGDMEELVDKEMTPSSLSLSGHLETIRALCLRPEGKDSLYL